MIVSVPSTARRTPPDTGASSMPTPWRASSAPSSRVPVGADEPMSTTTAPEARPSRSRSPGPSATRRTAAPSGSMVTTTSLRRRERRERPGGRGSARLGDRADDVVARVEHVELQPGGAHARRHRAAHVAEPDQTDPHQASGSASTSRATRKLSTAAGTPQ